MIGYCNLNFIVTKHRGILYADIVTIFSIEVISFYLSAALLLPISSIISLCSAVVPQPQGCEYSMLSTSHSTRVSKSLILFLGGENQNVNFHNSSGWSSSFTTRLQDVMDLSSVWDGPVASPESFRMSGGPSPVKGLGIQVSDHNSFQQIFTSAKNSLASTYFSINLLVDIAQIGNFEDMYCIGF